MPYLSWRGTLSSWLRPPSSEAPTWRQWETVARKHYKHAPNLSGLVSLNFSEELHAIEAAVSGQGIAICSDVLVAPELASGALVKVANVTLPGYGFYIMHRNSHPKLTSIKAFGCVGPSCCVVLGVLTSGIGTSLTSRMRTSALRQRRSLLKRDSPNVFCRKGDPHHRRNQPRSVSCYPHLPALKSATVRILPTELAGPSTQARRSRSLVTISSVFQPNLKNAIEIWSIE